jgi:hypothetical protein
MTNMKGEGGRCSGGLEAARRPGRGVAPTQTRDQPDPPATGSPPGGKTGFQRLPTAATLDIEGPQAIDPQCRIPRDPA